MPKTPENHTEVQTTRESFSGDEKPKKVIDWRLSDYNIQPFPHENPNGPKLRLVWKDTGLDI